MSAIRSLVVACAGRSPSLRSASAGVTGTRWALADVGFEVPDQFVVGYGLDAAQQYRHLPYIATLD